jgi:HK97 gp10 family phage protein
MKLDVHIDGLKEIEKVMQNLGPALAKREASGAVASGARVIRREIRANVPVGDKKVKRSKDYGKLRDNIRITRRKFARFSVEYAIHTGDAFWARFLEFGTVKMPPQPFFTSAFDRSKNAAVSSIISRLSDRLPKLAEEVAGRFGSISKVVKRRL